MSRPKYELDNFVVETYGMLDLSYMNSGEVNDYVYEIYSPLKAVDFFKDSIMATLLRDALGMKEYKRVYEYFKIPDIQVHSDVQQADRIVGITDLYNKLLPEFRQLRNL